MWIEKYGQDMVKISKMCPGDSTGATMFLTSTRILIGLKSWLENMLQRKVARNSISFKQMKNEFIRVKKLPTAQIRQTEEKWHDIILSWQRYKSEQ